MKCVSHQNAADQQHLKESGPEVKDQRAQNKTDSSRAAVDGFGQRSCLSAQVKAQIQVVKVKKDVPSDPSDGALSHFPKDSVPQLIEESRSSTRHAV